MRPTGLRGQQFVIAVRRWRGHCWREPRPRHRLPGARGRPLGARTKFEADEVPLRCRTGTALLGSSTTSKGGELSVSWWASGPRQGTRLPPRRARPRVGGLGPTPGQVKAKASFYRRRGRRPDRQIFSWPGLLHRLVLEKMRRHASAAPRAAVQDRPRPQRHPEADRPERRLSWCRNGGFLVGTATGGVYRCAPTQRRGSYLTSVDAEVPARWGHCAGGSKELVSRPQRTPRRPTRAGRWRKLTGAPHAGRGGEGAIGTQRPLPASTACPLTEGSILRETHHLCTCSKQRARARRQPGRWRDRRR